VVNGSVDKIYEVVVKFLNKKYCKKLNILAKINKKASN
jgi:hypothetical protein